MILIIIVALIIFIIIFEFTKFGYDYKALISGQKVAVNTGIKEKKNSLICYVLSGIAMSVVGFITASQMGYIEAGRLNFGSIGIMFTAFLPMFIGNYIGRFANNKLGYLFGALCTTLIGFAYAAFHFTMPMQSIITALLLVFFLIFLSNEEKIKHIVHRSKYAVQKR
jgi:ribose transport system permease protein